MSTVEEMAAAGRAVGEQLIGSAANLRDVATPEQLNNVAFSNSLDDTAFECEHCGWWHAHDEDNGAGLCEDCDAE